VLNRFKIVLPSLVVGLLVINHSASIAKEYDGIWFMGFNLKHELLQNDKVRGAIIRVIDREYSEETARLIDEEVKQILTDSHTRARDLLISRQAALEELAKLLLEKEVVDRPALQAILKVRSIDSAKEKNEKKKSGDTQENESHEKSLERDT